MKGYVRLNVAATRDQRSETATRDSMSQVMFVS